MTRNPASAAFAAMRSCEVKKGSAWTRARRSTSSPPSRWRSASLLVTDVSSVAADFLATGRPLVMTDPLSLGADAFHNKFPTAKAAYLLECGLGNLEEVLNDALGGDSLREERQRIFEYALGGFRGNATKAFDEALVRLAKDVAAKRLALQDG